MSDSLVIFGKTYSGVPSIIATDTNGTALQYIRPQGSKTINQNGSNIDVATYATVNVSVSGGGSPDLQTKSVSFTPTETAQSQTVTPDSGKDGLSSVEVSVGAISSTYVGSGIARKSSSDLTASGATVSVPAGYYSEASSKAVATANLQSPTISVDNYGTITAIVDQTEGYVGMSSTSSRYDLPTQSARTITPTKSSQTAVAAGKFTTGAITVAAIPASYQDVTGVTATASDVVSGKDIVNSSGTVVHGSLVIQHYYTGSSDPSASTGVNGDIYLKVVS